MDIPIKLPPYNWHFLGPTRPTGPNGIQIQSAVFTQFTGQTWDWTQYITSNFYYIVSYTATQPKNYRTCFDVRSTVERVICPAYDLLFIYLFIIKIVH